MMVIEMEPELAVFVRAAPGMTLTVLLGPVTWNVETGSKVKVPGPLVEKSYTVDTIKEFGSNKATNPISSKAYHYARQLRFSQQG